MINNKNHPIAQRRIYEREIFANVSKLGKYCYLALFPSKNNFNRYKLTEIEWSKLVLSYIQIMKNIE